MAAVLSVVARAQCPPPEDAQGETARLASVHDGDSLRLSDGRRVRLVGINAPEMARRDQAAEPLASEARAAVRDFFGDSEQIRLVYDRERQDHYGRTLAYVYNSAGQSLGAELLARGLAVHIAIPPNLALTECLSAQEAKARQRERGLWSHPYWQPRPASDLGPADAGFRLVRGRVRDVSINRGGVWLELDGPLVLQVGSDDADHFDVPDREAWQSWQGREVIVGGWIIDRSDSRAARSGFKPLKMRLRTPHALISNH